MTYIPAPKSKDETMENFSDYRNEITAKISEHFNLPAMEDGSVFLNVFADWDVSQAPLLNWRQVQGCPTKYVATIHTCPFEITIYADGPAHNEPVK
ncbi:hypothetical protein [Dermabacter hominis]